MSFTSFTCQRQDFNPPHRTLERQLSISEVCLRVRLPKDEPGIQVRWADGPLEMTWQFAANSIAARSN